MLGSSYSRNTGDRFAGGFWTGANAAAGSLAGPPNVQPSMETLLADVLNRFGLTDRGPDMLQELAEKDPDQFFDAALARLELSCALPTYRKRSLRLFDVPTFLLQLVHSDRFGNKELKEFFVKHIREDSLLDVKLARLLPGRRLDVYQLETRLILNILDVLDVISPGPRLLMIVGHLTQHDDRHVASKSTLLVGKRLQNRDWVERHLTSSDPRVRANVCEAFWNVNSALAAQTFRICLADGNNRVCGNALIGLHLIGDPSVDERTRQLSQDQRPLFRQTAAWVIGRLENKDLVPTLEQLSEDSDESVRRTAMVAMERFPRNKGAAPISAPRPEIRTTVDTSDQLAAQQSVVAVTGAASTTTIASATPVPEPAAGLATEAQCEPEPEAPPTPEPPPMQFNIRLDGRYVTGA